MAIKTTMSINPVTGLLDMMLDAASIIIPAGVPESYDASTGLFPVVVPGTAARWIISVAGTLPAPVGAVLPGDSIIYDGAARSVIHCITYPQSGTGSPVGVILPRYVGDNYIDQDGPTKYRSYGITVNDWIS